MISKKIIILNLKSLYIILNEIKSHLPFEIEHYANEEDLKKNENFSKKNFILIKPDQTSLKNLVIDDRIVYNFPDQPLEIDKLINALNILFIKLRYNYQSEIEIKKYILDINSRTISDGEKKLKLTEKEIDIILFLKENKDPQKIDNLQKEVWNYSSRLETHTVETHIYRLRKKINETFNDRNFILSEQEGYLIK